MVLLFHAALTFGVIAQGSTELRATLRLTLHLARPTFLMLFGAMLALVYLPRVERHGLAGVARRLTVRAGQCGLGYAATVAAAWVGGHRTGEEAIGAALLLGDSRFSNVLKLYAVALLLAIPWLALMTRFGRGVAVALGLIVWPLTPLLDRIDWPERDTALAHLTALVVGHPGGQTSFSVAHAFTLFSVGLLVGEALRRERDHADRGSLTRRALAIGLIGGAVGIGAVVQLDLDTFLRGMAGSFRTHHRIAWYAISAAEVALALLILHRLVQRWQLTYDGLRSWLVFGRRPLLAFALGNSLLNLVPPGTLLDPTVGLALSMLYPVAFGAALAAAESRLGVDRTVVAVP